MRSAAVHRRFILIRGLVALGFAAPIIGCGSRLGQIASSTQSSLTTVAAIGSSQTSPTAQIPPTAAGACIPTGRFDLVQAAAAGAGDIVLCPNAAYEVSTAITFSHAGQKIYTRGLPTDGSRAILKITGANVPAALRTDGKPGMDNIEIRNIQVDGNRTGLGAMPCGSGSDCAGVITIGNGSNQVVSQTKIWDARGWSHLVATAASGCQRIVIENNQIGPGGNSTDAFSDGISLFCPSSRVANNVINDVTDGAIVLFGAAGTVIENNAITSAARDMFLGIGLTDYEQNSGDDTGVIVRNNSIVAKGPSLMYVGIAAGDRLWFGNRYGANQTRGFSVSNNTFAGANYGHVIPVSGAGQIAIAGNVAAEVTRPFAYDPAQVTAAQLQSGFVPANLDNLIGRGIFVNTAYRTLLNRTADGGGYQSFVGNIAGGLCTKASLLKVLQDIVGTDEGARVIAARDDAAVVTSIYGAMFRRAPDAGALAYYVPLMNNAPNGRVARARDIIAAMGNAPEFLTAAAGVAGVCAL